MAAFYLIATLDTRLSEARLLCRPARRQLRRTVRRDSNSSRVVRDASAPFPGFVRADDGTRTHDLLHGNGEQPFASVRCRSLNRLVERIPGAPFACERTRTNAECCHGCHMPSDPGAARRQRGEVHRDAVMAVFRVPWLHEDKALRAVRSQCRDARRAARARLEGRIRVMRHPLRRDADRLHVQGRYERE
jgi:hypothetical protein